MLRPRVFVSHSSADKQFARWLADCLELLSIEVWFDDWEIAVGDSIVEKIFAGLEATDNLVVVLSEASIESRWLREEIEFAMMRRLSQEDIRLLPVRIDSCEIPYTLRHLKCADFGNNEEQGLRQLVMAILPMEEDWESLALLESELNALCDATAIRQRSLDETRAMIVALHNKLETALVLRARVEFALERSTGPRSMFDLLERLSDAGVDARGEVWHKIVLLRSMYVHSANQMIYEAFETGSFEFNSHETEQLRKVLKTVTSRPAEN